MRKCLFWGKVLIGSSAAQLPYFIPLFAVAILTFCAHPLVFTSAFPVIPDSQTCRRHSQNLLFLLLQKQLLLPNPGPTPSQGDKTVSAAQGGGALHWVPGWARPPHSAVPWGLARPVRTGESCGSNIPDWEMSPSPVTGFISRSDWLLQGWCNHLFWTDREVVVAAP